MTCIIAFPKPLLRQQESFDIHTGSNYCNNIMKTMELKVAQIGNSRGVRLPSGTLRRYSIGSVVLMEERVEGILLLPKASTDSKMSWADTAREMARSQDDWSDWDNTTGDGLDGVVWKPQSGLVAERRGSYETKSVKHRKPRTGGSA
jgi:antitoxin component of MazEF toxin-antitoxin module